MRKSNYRWAAAAALSFVIVLVLTVVSTQPAQAQTHKVIHNFTGGQDGANPHSGLTMDAAGNFYGTTYLGANGYGTVYKLTHKNSSWVLNPLYAFKGIGANDGAAPYGRVIFGPDGSLYGTTAGGGQGAGCYNFGNDTPAGCGTVFNLRPPATACKTVLCSWTENVLYRFTGGTDGGSPLDELVFDQAGNIYGSNWCPCNNDYGYSGNVYELMPSGGGWTETVLHSFIPGGVDGAAPNGVTFDDAGNLYGTTFYLGTNNGGIIFQLTPSGSGWAENILYDFQNGSDGGYPVGNLIVDGSGNLYGGTAYGGAGGGGTVFELSPSGGSWIFTVPYGFTGGTGPYSSLAMDAAGNIYGTTYADGANGFGNVFKLTPTGGGWTYTSLYDFTGGSDGAYPESKVSFDASGNLYGTTEYGGTYGAGVVFEIMP